MTDRDLATMCRKDRERERHRREILAVAERIFTQKGYHATTVEEIARESEFAVGTLYNLFEGKEDLYRNVIEGLVQDFMEQFEGRVLAVDAPEAAVAALIRLRLTHFDEHRAFIRIAFGVSPGGSLDPLRALPSRVEELRERYLEEVTGLFRRGIAEGTFDQADPLYLALLLEGIINAFVAYWLKNEPTEPLETRVAKMCREFIGRIKVRLNDSHGSAATP